MNNYTKKTFNAAAFNFLVYAISSISISICLADIKKELNFTLTQAGSFGFICSIEQTLILLFSPIPAARFGKIKVLKTALMILTAGLLSFAFVSNYTSALLSMMCMGLGTALIEALLTPIVGDLYPKEVTAKMNTMHAFWPLGICGGLVLFGYLLSAGVNWRFIYLGISAVAFFNIWIYPSSNKVNLPKSSGSISSIKKIFSMPAFWFFGAALFFTGGAEGAFAFWSATFIQLNLKTSALGAGIVTAFFSLGMIAGRFSGAKILRIISVQNLVLLSSALASLIGISFFFVDSVYKLSVFLFLMGCSLACLWPTIQSYASVVLPVDSTALMIFLSCFGVPGYSASSFIMGIIGDKLGLFRAFASVVPIFIILTPLLFLIACKIAGRPARNIRT